MQKQDLSFDYPAHLIATEKKALSRVMMVESGEPLELSIANLLAQIGPQDLLIINDTQVIPARVTSEEGLEILFIEEHEPNVWSVLCPSRRWPKQKNLMLPDGVEVELLEKALPQKISSNKKLDMAYFDKWGDLPLPPYIQEARGERGVKDFDKVMYQSDWAEQVGSLAAPTASLHFKKEDLHKIKNRGARVKKLCLHVGLGTFLPIHSSNLDEHKMHSEFVSIPKDTWQAVQDCKKQGGQVWALGSTVTRSLEAMALGDLLETEKYYRGHTSLFICPGFEFKVVDVLMTNFHQPETTLLAMVMAFAGVEDVKQAYQWAIERNFRLFSYGDLSVWKK